MTLSDFRARQLREGWLRMAEQAFALTPCETYFLDLLTARPGQVAAFEELQAFDGRNSRSQSRESAKKRIERLRDKLSDVGCEGVILLVTDHHGPATGYAMSAAGVRCVESALLFALGVEEARAA